jgi:hypothetical protein
MEFITRDLLINMIFWTIPSIYMLRSNKLIFWICVGSLLAPAVAVPSVFGQYFNTETADFVYILLTAIYTACGLLALQTLPQKSGKLFWSGWIVIPTAFFIYFANYLGVF